MKTAEQLAGRASKEAVRDALARLRARHPNMRDNISAWTALVMGAGLPSDIVGAVLYEESNP